MVAVGPSVTTSPGDRVERGQREGLLIRVADFADEKTLAGLEIGNAFDLTGLYQGIPLTERSVMDVGTLPDTIWLYRRPILNEWAERGGVTLAALAAHGFEEVVLTAYTLPTCSPKPTPCSVAQ